jgi:serine/threonine protein kinase
MKEFIGKGHFGEVYKVQDKLTSRIYAVKVKFATSQLFIIPKDFEEKGFKVQKNQIALQRSEYP